MLAFTPLLAGLGAFLGRITATRTQIEQEKYAIAGAMAEETFSSIRTVLSLNGTGQEISRCLFFSVQYFFFLPSHNFFVLKICCKRKQKIYFKMSLNSIFSGNSILRQFEWILQIWKSASTIYEDRSIKVFIHGNRCRSNVSCNLCVLCSCILVRFCHYRFSFTDCWMKWWR